MAESIDVHRVEPADAALFDRRIAAALARRARLPIASDALRLVHGEADGLPGLVVDRYADTLCAQFGAAGVERWRDDVADAGDLRRSVSHARSHRGCSRPCASPRTRR